ncbi:MAG: hypothetical protein ACK449_18805 [Planctomycetota bacterium]|jgi:hypothetical protein
MGRLGCFGKLFGLERDFVIEGRQIRRRLQGVSYLAANLGPDTTSGGQFRGQGFSGSGVLSDKPLLLAMADPGSHSSLFSPDFSSPTASFLYTHG